MCVCVCVCVDTVFCIIPILGEFRTNYYRRVGGDAKVGRKKIEGRGVCDKREK